jgi:hypothetical protein
MSKLSPDLDLLKDLNEICNICIGNESAEDCSFNQRTTLPEILAYCELYPNNIQAVRDAKNAVKKVSTRLGMLLTKIQVMETKITIKYSKYK